MIACFWLGSRGTAHDSSRLIQHRGHKPGERLDDLSAYLLWRLPTPALKAENAVAAGAAASPGLPRGEAQKMKALLGLVAICAMLSSSFAVAHSGGTDSQGCHIDHKTGVRHCH